MENVLNLYKEGKQITEIASITGIDRALIESFIIDFKLKNIENISSSGSESILEQILKLNKNSRIEFLHSFEKNKISILEEEIFVYMEKNKRAHYEDIVTIIWLIGELKLENLSEIICALSASKNGNIQRIAYSTMGKFYNERFVPYLKMGCKNNGIQIRMYAIKSLSKYNFADNKKFFASILQNENNLKNREILEDIIRGL